MLSQTFNITLSIAVGILIGGCGALIVIRLYQKHSHGQHQPKEERVSSLPICANGVNTSIDSSASLSVLSVSDTNPGLQCMAKRNAHWNLKRNKDVSASLSGVPRYSYSYKWLICTGDIQRATQIFTTVLGQGSFGPLYQATMPTGELVAVKVLAGSSSQGEKEFQTEVLVLSRLHHRNLVNLVGYCVDKKA
ncbi:STYKc, partial [Musa troglodytarum]